MKANKLILGLIGAGIVVIGGIFLINRSQKTAVPKLNNNEEIVEHSQKTVDEQQTGEGAEISFKRTMSQNEEIAVEFMMHDYASAPEDSTPAELKDSLTPLKGEASFKIREVGTMGDIDKFNKSGEGKSFHYIIYDFKGKKSNPEGNTIHPSSLDETGWDPAPQFVTIIDGDDDWPGSYWEDDLLEQKGYEDPPFGTDFNTAEWVTKAAVWKVSDQDSPDYALKYVDPQSNELNYIKVSP